MNITAHDIQTALCMLDNIATAKAKAYRNDHNAYEKAGGVLANSMSVFADQRARRNNNIAKGIRFMRKVADCLDTCGITVNGNGVSIEKRH